jgi:spermidine synthase
LSATVPEGQSGPGKSLRLLVYFVFFLSGAAALIYEISWSRQIGLLFGHTVHAATVVLASYFSGMAIGYWVGARWSARISPLAGYAIAELVVATWAFIIPLLLSLSETSTIAPWLSSSSFAWQTAARVAFSFLLLLPGTIALGVTLPMIAAFFSGGGIGNLENATNASRVTTAYALNTAGALVGVLSATFYLLVIVGVRSSSYFAAALSVVCALLALLAGRRNRIVEPASSDVGEIPETSSAESTEFSLSTLVLLSLLSGFGILALQVLYTRMFSLVFHNSTYTFGIVVAVFLGSLALGAGLASKFQNWWGARRVIGVATGLGAMATSMSVIVFIWLTKLKYFTYGDSFVEYMSGAILLVTVVVAPAITCLGMLLPLVWSLAGRSGSAGRVVGRLTAVNTLAGAVGALAASFCLLTWIGLWQSIVLISILFFFAAFVLLWHSNQKRVALSLGLLIGVTSVFAWGSPIESEYDQKKYGERLNKRWNSSNGRIDVVQR